MIINKKQNFVRIALIVLLLAVAASGWARGAYKWVDENGTVHYSDRLTSDNAEVIKVPVHEPEGSTEESADNASSDGQDGSHA